MNGRRNKELIPLTISVKEARRILGGDADEFTDDEISRILGEMFALAKAYIEAVQKS